MRRAQHNALQRVRVFLSVALILVPLALSGHFHTTSEHVAPDACAACATKHHSPTASPQPLALAAPLFSSLAVVVSPVTAPASVARPTYSGRAPPVLFTVDLT